ncbi:MAG: magnesium transporter CorA family protein [Actinomycetota bacterium]|nr:magnesium transporter CorA family protein [Actinomycetota bacterium]
MAGPTTWIDLLDPSEAELREHVPSELHPGALQQMLRPASLEGAGRPTLQGHHDYVFGVVLVAVAVPEEDRLFYQEIDLVLTRNRLVTVRKTPPGEAPFDPEPVRATCERKGHTVPGMVVYHLVDDVAERYLDIVDALDDEIDELESHVDDWPNERTRARISALRRDLLHLRRTLAPTREAVHGVMDGRVDLEGRALFAREVFPAEIEREFGTAHDKLLRATEMLELARDLLAAARDYHQNKISVEQNDVTKRLAVIASLLLFPTFVVGVYGQNFEHMPELGWRLGYAFSWAIVVVTTLLQLAFFRWRRWI